MCQEAESLQELNTRVMVISFGTFPSAQAWLKETCSSFPFLLDPDRTVYQIYGMERSLWRSWGLKTIWAYMRLLSAGRKWRGIQGDSAQLGGDYIVDANGIIRLAYISHDPTDRPSVEALLTSLREIAR